MSPGPDERCKADLLAAVLIHLLTDGGAHAMTVEQLASEAERDSEFEEDRAEVALALSLLAEYELATEDAEGAWRPTRAAVESARLSF
jgi:hypothetical protein